MISPSELYSILFFGMVQRHCGQNKMKTEFSTLGHHQNFYLSKQMTFVTGGKDEE